MPILSESEIDERTEIGGVECRNAKHESEGCKAPCQNVLFVGKIRKIDLFLHFQAELRQCEEREESRNNHSHIQLAVGREIDWSKVEGKHALNEHPGEIETLDAEKHPDDAHRKEGEDDGRYPAQFLRPFGEEKFVGTNENAMQGTPNDEIPRCAVPQTRNKETQPEVEIHARLVFHAVAAKRNVKVIPDETA